MLYEINWDFKNILWFIAAIAAFILMILLYRKFNKSNDDNNYAGGTDSFARFTIIIIGCLVISGLIMQGILSAKNKYKAINEYRNGEYETMAGEINYYENNGDIYMNNSVSSIVIGKYDTAGYIPKPDDELIEDGKNYTIYYVHNDKGTHIVRIEKGE